MLVNTEPETGWRTWYLPAGQPYLESLINHEPWPHGERMEAACGAFQHLVPDLDCVCGIHAKKERALVPKRWPSVNCFIVVGQVSLWGKVLEHERGWRAQYAYPYSLMVIAPKSADSALVQKAARDLRGNYVVDVTVRG